MHNLQSFKKRGTRTPFYLGFKAPKGVCPSVPQLPIRRFKQKALATWETGVRDIFKSTKRR